MATVVLAAAGASIGGAAGGAFLGVSAAAIGQAAGAIVGGLIDQAVFGSGQRAVVRGKAHGLRVQGAEEGAPVAQCWGRMRFAGHVIWSTRFLENATGSGGGKGSGPSVTTYSYTIGFAVALCEGRIDGIGRVWADGKPLDLEKVSWRLHRGTEDQGPDPLIEATEGWAPAYRGTAYIVFEDFPASKYGNRVPQITVEVIRTPEAPEDAGVPEAGLAPEQIIQGVALSPGSGEFSLSTQPVRVIEEEGRSRTLNANAVTGKADLLVSLDQLQEELPEAKAVSLVVSWFGDDLRCGECLVRPGVEYNEKVTAPETWTVAGQIRATAYQVSRDAEGGPVYGGTPSDQSVIDAIREMQDRGMRVMFYPFLLMDIPAGNGLPDPWGWGAEQAAFPWRGRITTSLAPGQPGSPDQTAAAAAEVASFFGTAQPTDFSLVGDQVHYSGPAEWTLRRMVLHYAWLCKAAGGVHAFCIGSEMRSLTQVRDGRVSYPAVQAFRQLAQDVRAVLGDDVNLGYAADWSEYFGHQPQDGTGDRIFHLDPLWADAAIDFVGIDYYAPLTDWREGYEHLDAQETSSIYDLDYLASRFAAGEGYDWYYASDADRAAQIRTPIRDGLIGEDWIWRNKDIRNWWKRYHHDRIDGVRQSAPSAWRPESKPVWLTEIGCGAVDKGTNQPNVFVDSKSSESGLPHFSDGQRDDLIQRRMLQAAWKHWSDAANNPVSAVYNRPMLDLSNTYVWTWDARPWPAWPNRADVWSDASAHETGHWITGRVSAASLAAVVAEICADAGLTQIDVSGLEGVVAGFADAQVRTPRENLQALMLAYGFDAVESGGKLVFRMRGRAPVAEISRDEMVEAPDGRVLELTRLPEAMAPERVRIGFVRAEASYQAGVEEALSDDEDALGVKGAELTLALTRGQARAIAERWLREAVAARDKAQFALGPGHLALEPGDVVSLPDAGGGTYRIDRITDGEAREIEATRVDGSLYLLRTLPGEDEAPAAGAGGDGGPPAFRLIDAPWDRFGGSDNALFAAVWADPWPGSVQIFSSDRDDGYLRKATVDTPSVVARLLDDLPAGDPWLFTRHAPVRVEMLSGTLQSADRLALASGANLCALSTPDGQWELLQFQQADLQPDGTYLLSRFLRGIAGTEVLIGDPAPAGSTLVLLDDRVVQIEQTEGSAGLERHYRFAPTGVDFTDPSVAYTTFTWNATALRPFAPSAVEAVIEPSGDVSVRWTRRSRKDIDTFFAAYTPLSEAFERYRVRVLDSGGAVVRQAETSVPSWTYAFADRSADNISGAVTIAVAQISEAFGPGSEGKVTYSD
ncbi:baseplate multidomain protein megatron [Rhodovulum sp. DZ06]|uniref:baseplate multidomain protein megatron n=1 Tax=Rhodovulum sp. DZ06 TaxID=3425126 RepID=UPI003D32F14A